MDLISLAVFSEDNSLKEWSFKKAITIQTYSSYHPVPVPLNLISHLFLCIRCLRQMCARECAGTSRKIQRRKIRNTSLDAVVEKLQLAYFSTYGYSFPLTDERKMDHVLKETERNRQMANQIAYRTFTSRGFDEDIYFTGPKAWQSKGIRVQGCLLTCEGSEYCSEWCKHNPVKYHGARYLYPFSLKMPHFEVLIQETGERRLLAVGVVGEDYGNHALPGWFQGSVGYHADDGKIFDAANPIKGVEYEDAMAYRGDLIGCTVRFDLAEDGKVPIVFSLNGKQINHDKKWMEYTPNKKSLYPYIGMAHNGITVLAKMCLYLDVDIGLETQKNEDGGQAYADRVQLESILKTLENVEKDFQSGFQRIDASIRNTLKGMKRENTKLRELADDVFYDFERFETQIKYEIEKSKAKGFVPKRFFGKLPACLRVGGDTAERFELQYLCEKDATETSTSLKTIKEKAIGLEEMTKEKFSAVFKALQKIKEDTQGNSEKQIELMQKVKKRFHDHEKFIRTNLPIT